jgi:hypothetical protein
LKIVISDFLASLKLLISFDLFREGWDAMCVAKAYEPLLFLVAGSQYINFHKVGELEQRTYFR